MLSSAAAVGFLQANFKRAFEDAEKEVEVAINQLIRASVGSNGTTEKCDAQKKVSNALSEIKKQMTKFNTSALFFIELNIDLMNPQLHKHLLGSGDNLLLPKANGNGPKRKKEQTELAGKGERNCQYEKKRETGHCVCSSGGSNEAGKRWSTPGSGKQFKRFSSSAS